MALEHAEAIHDARKRGATVFIAPMAVMKLARAIDTDAHKEVVLVQKSAPGVVKQGAIRLERIGDAFASSIALLQREGLTVEIDTEKRRFAALPCESDLRSILAGDKIADETFEHGIAHAKRGRFGKKGLLFEVKAVVAIEVTSGTGRLAHQMERKTRGGIHVEGQIDFARVSERGTSLRVFCEKMAVLWGWRLRFFSFRKSKSYRPDEVVGPPGGCPMRSGGRSAGCSTSRFTSENKGRTLTTVVVLMRFLPRVLRFDFLGRGFSRRGLVAAASAWLLTSTFAMVFGVLGACRRPEPVAAVAPLSVAAATEQKSVTCQACHAEIFAAWSNTDHALANRPVEKNRDQTAFMPARTIEDGKSRFDVSWTDKGPTMVERDGENRIEHHPEFVLGNLPSHQMLLPAAGGRWQPTDLAWDPAKTEWFNVFGQEGRHRGEWGHWTGRGMNWNSMCAHCHMTGFEKGYDAATDTFASTWVEHGVGCIQCHGPMPADHNRTGSAYKAPAGAWTHDRQRAMQTCAPCHARNELLTTTFQPGDAYHDHHRMALPSQPLIYYPDGQQRDEDFNWTSVLLSRMGHAGVTCMDCHDPHTTKTILPVENNALCMQCHAAPGRMNAKIIDPTAHSHHAEGSTGNRCVECHMPTTNYMVRSPRHDHGWLKPDPLLTKELDIPNACSRCHTDQTVDWAIQKADAWYGEKLDSRQRARARAVAGAQANRNDASARLLALLKDEDIPAWRATFMELSMPYAAQPEVTPVLRAGLTDPDPLVRAAAARALAGLPEARAWLRPLLQDPVRLVRLDAAWTLADELVPGSAVEKEMQEYLAVAGDQPAGQVRLGQHLANVGRLDEAEAAVRKAIPWDPYSSAIHENLGLIQQAAGRLGDAATSFYRAGQIDGRDGAIMLRAGLAYAEAGRLTEAETALREAVRRDPQLHRAWYNLGLLLAQTNRPIDAIAMLFEAEKTGPGQADYPYALATLYWKVGDRTAARQALERTLAIDPNHEQARGMLESLPAGR